MEERPHVPESFVQQGLVLFIAVSGGMMTSSAGLIIVGHEYVWQPGEPRFGGLILVLIALATYGLLRASKTITTWWLAPTPKADAGAFAMVGAILLCIANLLIHRFWTFPGSAFTFGSFIGISAYHIQLMIKLTLDEPGVLRLAKRAKQAEAPRQATEE